MRTAQKMFVTFILSSACILVYQYQLSRARYISQDLDHANGDIEVLKLSVVKKLLSSSSGGGGGGSDNSTTSTTTTTSTTPPTTKLKIISNENHIKNNTNAQKRQTNTGMLHLANTNFNNNNDNDGNRCTCDHKDATNSERHVIILFFALLCFFIFFRTTLLLFFFCILRATKHVHSQYIFYFFFSMQLHLNCFYFTMFKSLCCFNIGGQRASRTQIHFIARYLHMSAFSMFLDKFSV